jgi:prepilin-type processing-associated H-X9-DG protein
MEQLEIPVPQPPSHVQFSLKTILAVTTGFAMLFAAGSWFGPAGYVGFVLLAVFGALCAFPRNSDVSALCSTLLLVGLVVMCCIFLLLPDTGSRGSPKRDRCTNNLKQIGLGLQNYTDIYRCFPPAYITDENGKPMHSWRVLILPFIEQKALYDRYDFDEPWDGPNNSKLAKEMPPIFACPSDIANPGILTDYVALVGPETMWQPDHGTTFKEIKDGSTQTIAVIEATGAGINWMEPRDLPFSAVSKGINPKQGVGISSHHPGAVIALFADGHTQTIQERLSIKLLNALCTKSGGEAIDGDF